MNPTISASGITVVLVSAYLGVVSLVKPCSKVKGETRLAAKCSLESIPITKLKSGKRLGSFGELPDLLSQSSILLGSDLLWIKPHRFVFGCVVDGA